MSIASVGAAAALSAIIALAASDRVRCRLGSVEHCSTIASSEETPPELREAALERGCTLADLNACEKLGAALAYSGPVGAPGRFGQARRVVGGGCEQGHPGCCFRLGDLLARGLGGDKDEKGATTAYRTACDGKHAAACVALGEMRESEDAAAARKYFEAACSSHAEAGCANVRRLERIAKRPAEPVAQPSSSPLTTLNETLARMDVMLGDVAREKKQHSAAVGHYHKACEERHFAAGCARLADAMLSGKGVRKNPAQARQMLREACFDDYGPACLSYAHDLAKQGPTGRILSVPLLERSCTGAAKPLDFEEKHIISPEWGSWQAANCELLAVIYSKSDPVKSWDYASKACDGGHRDACKRVGRSVPDSATR